MSLRVFTSAKWSGNEKDPLKLNICQKISYKQLTFDQRYTMGKSETTIYREFQRSEAH